MSPVRCPLCGRKTTVDGATRVAPHKRADEPGKCPLGGHKLQGEGEELAARELRARAEDRRVQALRYPPESLGREAIRRQAEDDDARAHALLVRASTHSASVMYELSAYDATGEPVFVSMFGHRVPPRGPEDFERARVQLEEMDRIAFERWPLKVPRRSHLRLIPGGKR